MRLSSQKGKVHQLSFEDSLNIHQEDFMLESEYSNITDSQVSRIFGSNFSKPLVVIPFKEWSELIK